MSAMLRYLKQDGKDTTCESDVYLFILCFKIHEKVTEVAFSL